jgi:hypothetical protein
LGQNEIEDAGWEWPGDGSQGKTNEKPNHEYNLHRRQSHRVLDKRHWRCELEAAVASMEKMAAAKVEGPVEGRHRGGAADVSLSSLNVVEDMIFA